jgi:hypothetical protein
MLRRKCKLGFGVNRNNVPKGWSTWFKTCLNCETSVLIVSRELPILQICSATQWVPQPYSALYYVALYYVAATQWVPQPYSALYYVAFLYFTGRY